AGVVGCASYSLPALSQALFASRLALLPGCALTTRAHYRDAAPTGKGFFEKGHNIFRFKDNNRFSYSYPISYPQS
ncbi:MAG: hypothetical protein LRY38_08185, partial [Aeromonadaceae bacterium]|nr:hypothetical protein [Aeromonadaceae bacterium]